MVHACYNLINLMAIKRLLGPDSNDPLHVVCLVSFCVDQLSCSLACLGQFFGFTFDVSHHWPHNMAGQ